MDPTVSSGTINPTVPMTLPTYYTGLQGAPPDSSMQTAPPTYMTSLVTPRTASSVTPSQSPPAKQPICSKYGCTGHPHTEPNSHPHLSAMQAIPPHLSAMQAIPPHLSAMQAIPPTYIHHSPDISNTSNKHIPTPTPAHIHNANHQSVNSIAQKVPNGVPIAHGYIYGYNQLLNSQQNANNRDKAGTRPKKISCYNCGSSKHLGPECTEKTMEEMLDTFRLDFRPTGYV